MLSIIKNNLIPIDEDYRKLYDILLPNFKNFFNYLVYVATMGNSYKISNEDTFSNNIISKLNDIVEITKQQTNNMIEYEFAIYVLERLIVVEERTNTTHIKDLKELLGFFVYALKKNSTNVTLGDIPLNTYQRKIIEELNLIETQK